MSDSRTAADVVLLGGRILTMDPAWGTVTALAVTEGTVVAAGSDVDVANLVGDRTRVVRLHGRTVVPGLNDTHAHIGTWSVTAPPLMRDVGPTAAQSIRDVAEIVAAAEPGDDGWIRGQGWDMAELGEYRDSGRLPRREDLDAVAPNVPVVLQDQTLHQVWANTEAMRRAGVADGAGDRPADTDADGRPTGLFRESAQSLILDAVPALSRDALREAIARAITQLNSWGITSFTEPGLGPGGDRLSGGAMGTRALAAYRDLAQRRELSARVSVLRLFAPIGTGTAEDIRTGLEELDEADTAHSRWVNPVGVKVFADGIPPSGTSWTTLSYPDHSHGCLVVGAGPDQDRVHELHEMVRVVHEHGLQVGVHVTGDRAIEATLDAFDAAESARPGGDPRHYVIHGDMASDAMLDRMARAQWALAAQPAVLTATSGMQVAMLGEEHVHELMRCRSALHRGVPVTLGSDASVTQPDWRLGVAAACSRRSTDGRVWGPQETMTPLQALRGYTSTAAWLDHAEEWKGTLRPGNVADLAVLDGFELDAADPEPEQVRVLATLVDGQAAHAEGSLADMLLG